MGGIEPTLYRGSVWYTPIVEEWYYQVEVLKLEVGNQNLDLDCREVRSSLSQVLQNGHLTPERSTRLKPEGSFKGPIFRSSETKPFVMSQMARLILPG